LSLRGGFAIARVLGIPIRVNPSWLASFLLVVSVLSLQLPVFFPGRGSTLYFWSLGLLGGVVYFASIVLHELGHSVVARRYGIPVTSITLFIFGGVSQIAREASRPGAELLMAVAGPAVSVLLGVIFLLAGVFLLPAGTPVGLLVQWLGLMNLALAVFNLLPGFPMDGGRVFRSAVWGVSGNYRLATRAAEWLSRGLSLLIIAFGLAAALQVRFLPIRFDAISGVWLILVGMFLYSAAGQSQLQSKLLDVLRSYRAEQLLTSDVPAVPSEATARSVAYQLPFQQDQSAYFVFCDGRMVGLLPRNALTRLPVERWGDVPVSEVMIPAERIRPASPEEDGVSLMQRMDSEGLPALPVVKNGTVLGLVTRSALADLIRRHPQLRHVHR
jgi:Zn-dependent protease